LGAARDALEARQRQEQEEKRRRIDFDSIGVVSEARRKIAELQRLEAREAERAAVKANVSYYKNSKTGRKPCRSLSPGFVSEEASVHSKKLSFCFRFCTSFPP